MVLSVVAAALLLATGYLGSSRVTGVVGEDTSVGGWQVTTVEFNPDWRVAVPLALCFVVGLLCAVLPRRRLPRTD
jgi:hypothetical protein